MNTVWQRELIAKAPAGGIQPVSKATPWTPVGAEECSCRVMVRTLVLDLQECPLFHPLTKHP